MLGFADIAFKAHNRRLDAATLSKALKPVFRDKEQIMIKSIFDEKFLEGKLEGKLEEKVNGILKLLRLRCKRVPKHVIDELNSRTDLIALDSLFEVAAQSNSIKEFEEALR
jgi:hypothetical protein